MYDTDEYPRRDVTLESLSNLKAAFQEGGRVTAGNASGMNDAAAGILLMEEEKAKGSRCADYGENSVCCDYRGRTGADGHRADQRFAEGPCKKRGLPLTTSTSLR